MTMTESNPAERGKPVIKSTEMEENGIEVSSKGGKSRYCGIGIDLGSLASSAAGAECP